MTTPTDTRPKLALWFRYGAAEHAELFHAMPELVNRLAETTEVHYYGFKSDKALPEAVQGRIIEHPLPWSVNRSPHRDKLFKTFLWYLCLPFIGLRSRLTGVQAVFIDESLPLVPLISRVFFGKRRGIVVADFFSDIYLGESSTLTRILNALDVRAWRSTPVLFTKTRHTANFLVEHGVQAERIHTVYDPCNTDMYHPAPRDTCRQTLGISPEALVLVHHGILHPNKGLDRVIKQLPTLAKRYPTLLFLVVGDGPHRQALEALVDELGLKEHVRFTGWLPQPSDVNTALCAGDIGLVMRIGQKADHFHVTGTLVHNMACGLPVLCADLAGIREIVDDQSGLFFNPANMEHFDEGFATLSDDIDRRQQMGETAYKVAMQQFSSEIVADRTAQPLLDLLDPTGSSCN